MHRCAATAGFVAALLLTGARPGFAAEVSEKLAPCLACHGAEGQSQIENVPSLGAQIAPYSLIQLFMYREKMRVNEPMNEAAKELTNDELQSMAEALLPPCQRRSRRTIRAIQRASNGPVR